jgi:hypothetical protein
MMCMCVRVCVCECVCSNGCSSCSWVQRWSTETKAWMVAFDMYVSRRIAQLACFSDRSAEQCVACLNPCVSLHTLYAASAAFSISRDQ